ncbi:DUF1569 domain-containing protein [Poriferisphaera sp. WC338]|uniref:DUF1569 domain-containing protein n=1 Tax=Poriferisphaera sp. WC338 TaxID=3425129 RepID=UPI003D818D88
MSETQTHRDIPLKRRTLYFQNIDQILEEADRLASGDYQKCADWSLGQNCHHLATWMVMCMDGLPHFPMILRILIRAVFNKDKILQKGFKPGMNVRGKLKKLEPTSDITDETGLEALHKAVERFRHEPKLPAHPLLGKMSDDDWLQLHLRHAEHHLGMIHPM